MKQLIRLLVSLFVFNIIISCSSVGNEQLITISTSVSEDATPALLSAIESINADVKTTIVFEEGTYNFYPDKAIEKYTHTSNHGDYISRIAFYLEDIKNLTIDGNGSKFIFHNRIYPFFITESNNITLKDFSIDYATRFGSEPVVVANNKSEHTFDLEMPKGEQYEIRNNILYFVAQDYEFTIGQSILYDPNTNSVAYNTEKYTPISGYIKIKNQVSYDFKYVMDDDDTYQKVRGREYSIYAKEVKPGIVRIYGHKQELPPVGMVLSCKGEQGVNRLAPAIKIDKSVDFLAKNVIVYHASGMGFLGENSENLTLDSCKVIPSEGYMVSATADATHFVGCRGKVVLKDCEFRNQLDDATNIHGAYQPIVDIIDDYTVGVRMGHFQQQGFVLARVADTIGIVRIADSFHAYDMLTVKSVKYINGRYNQITFNEKLPKKLAIGDYAENLSAYPTAEITGCYIGGNRARGLLLSTPKGTLVENNTFSTEMEAILIPVESSHWYESGNGIDIVIKNNHFKNSNFSGFERGVIRFRTDDDLSNTAFSNISIVGNQFDQFDSMILEASNIDGLVFKGNTITNSGTYEPLFPNSPALTFKYCKNVELGDNVYKGEATKMVEMLDGTPVIEFK